MQFRDFCSRAVRAAIPDLAFRARTTRAEISGACRPPACVRLAVAAIVAGGLVAITAPSAKAQGRLDARYVAKLSGIPIGKGAWVVEINEDQFVAAATGGTSGLLRVVASGEGRSSSRGKVTNGQLIPAAFASTIVSGKKTDQVRLAIASGVVKEVSIEPEPQPNPERVPLSDSNRRGVSDPMTASLVRVPGNADPVRAEACDNTVAVFDGQMRYDIKLEFRRIETVKAEKGYQGPAVVCGIYFSPIAGHVPGRAAIKYLIAQRKIEVWLAPIAGTRTLAPFRVSVPTPLGVGTLEATQFETQSLPRLTPASAKMQ